MLIKNANGNIYKAGKKHRGEIRVYYLNGEEVGSYPYYYFFKIFKPANGIDIAKWKLENG